jgi:hypothetical protein
LAVEEESVQEQEEEHRQVCAQHLDHRTHFYQKTICRRSRE